MFNLLIGVDPHSSRNALRFDRVLSYTEDGLRSTFVQDGDKGSQRPLRIDEVTKLPTLFMPEKDLSSGSQQLAYVGRVVDCTQDDDGGVKFKFAHDSLPPIPIPAIWDLRNELGIEDFEFYHTHWAIKGASLFAVLYRHALKHSPRPRIHGVDRVLQIDPNQVSVMIRFRPDFEQVFEAVKQAAEAEDFKCHRVKDIWQQDAIITDIANLIMRSRIVVADLTDRNANVFYECGLAHGVGREVIPITQDRADNFDVQHLRHIEYQNTEPGREELSRQLRARFKALRSESY